MPSDSSSQPQGSSSADRNDGIAAGPSPLSPRASRFFVIASIVFVIAATAGSTYYLVSMTSQALNTPMDSTATEMPTDTTMTAPDSLR